ncbi:MULTISPECIES: SNF2-related protein [Cupriavidus]|uniref:DNA/RNA helicase, SNF2 family n=3 Tax=Cupriavidus TaxID=106589 RepID=A0A375DB55_9BURK|nr:MULTISPECIES: SNF2-related protein [Cupriavidus]MCO4865711.1 SNF2-related protein [Cupriavidus sp. WGlv3]MCO4893465.1 SNF2-related protein [Cupriavidus sp. WGtm5]ULX56048.1 DEAD/DEAH box helicase [Cupriavidus taiwanensis]CAP64284.1 putative DNA/RNA helicase, SNF2 family [Cupriavidus taiwanensis LMG 19424]SOY74268.1 putative DNA/RNA helicase, SNF2 family [Cupriavidus taiwanensis]
MITAYHAKYFASELSRRYSAADSEKLAGTLLDAQVDLNPHQLEAALFAFRSPLSKGAILADEVGLGKTIEAGLVLAQKWAEGKRRILIVTPANLRKQWTQEMAEKFFLPTVILEAKNYLQLQKSGVRRPFEQPSMVVCSYQFAAKHAEELMTTRWDLVIMDEAHRLRNVYRPDNKIGNTLKRALANAPKLLLTATPLQNSLLELYGLVSIIDDYAFGDARSFRTQFARLNGDGNFNELKARLKPVCHRTLRRQVLEYIRYTNRIPITEEFVPSDVEHTLYEMVSDYLRRPSLYALPSSQRQLMTLILRKLLASSTFAIAGALESLANKLRKQLPGNASAARSGDGIEDDFEEFEEYADEWGADAQPEPLTAEDVASIDEEIASLEEFRALAVSISENAKGMALLKALRAGFEKARELGAAEKTIVFTESRRTQDYLVCLLTENGYAGKLVLFNGSNSDKKSKAIYAEWVEANKGTDKVTGSRTADIRAALVDYFRDHATVMIATEAAAEGINLQFCSMVVNYDLPWNPQRIEQRIGRCHRYGQRYDVVVVNFLNRKNEADRRVFELLSEKFRLFSGVFGASDEVLGAIESGVEFEKRIVAIYQNCRTPAEIEGNFRQLQEEMDAHIISTMEDTRQKLLENFDAEVHDRLRVNLDESRSYINRHESMLWALTRRELEDKADFDAEELRFRLLANPFPEQAIPVGAYALAKDPGKAHRYRIGHPLAQAVIASAAGRPLPEATIEFVYSDQARKAASIEPFVGMSGYLLATKLSIYGADAQDHIILTAMTDGGLAVPEDTVRRFLEIPAEIVRTVEIDGDATVRDAANRRKNEILEGLAAQQAVWFDEEMEKLNGWAEDKRRGLKAELKDYDDRINELKKQARCAPTLPEKLEVQKKLRDLDKKRDEAWREYDGAAKDVEWHKDELLDQIEDQLRQTAAEEVLFCVRWTVR